MEMYRILQRGRRLAAMKQRKNDVENIAEGRELIYLRRRRVIEALLRGLQEAVLGRELELAREQLEELEQI